MNAKNKGSFRSRLRPILKHLPVLFCCCLGFSVAISGCAHRESINGKVVVITGASSGFGKGVALKMAEQGAHVVLAARRTELLDSLAAECQKRGGQALAVTTDVANDKDVVRLAQSAVQRFGRIDVWINDAGVGVIGRFWDVPVEDYSRLVDINLKGVIYGSHAAVRQFRTQGAGTLVNVGSIDSEVPLAYQASYSATKAGVLSLGRALNEELRLNGMGKKIRVATVMPWATDTPWWRHAANYSGGTRRMAAMDGPEKVVDAMIRASLHPKEEMPVGWKARSAYVSHHLFPDMTERFSGNVAHKYQIEGAPPAPPTSGSLYKPMEGGTGVDDGVRQRIAEEKGK
jgi:short-subunit dehydrogenase